MKPTEQLVKLKERYQAINKEGLLTLQFPDGFPETITQTTELKREKNKIYSDYNKICLADIPLRVAFESKDGAYARVYFRGSNKAESPTLTRLAVNFLNKGRIEDEILKPSDVTSIGRSFYVDTMPDSTLLQEDSNGARFYQSAIMDLITSIEKNGYKIDIVKLRDFDVGRAE